MIGKIVHPFLFWTDKVDGPLFKRLDAQMMQDDLGVTSKLHLLKLKKLQEELLKKTRFLLREHKS
jgi:hypothetical protein